MSWFTQKLVVPAVGWVQQLELKAGSESVKSIMSKSGVIREILAVGYNSVKSEIALENMDENEKRKLWEESKVCVDRLEYCQAIRFYESVKQFS